MKPHHRCHLLFIGLAFCLFGIQAHGQDLKSSEGAAGTTLSLGEVPFHLAEAGVEGLAELDAPGLTRVFVWTEAATPHYAISLDGKTVARVRATDYTLKLRHGAFVPPAAPDLSSSVIPYSGGELYLVQFHTQPLEAYRARLRELGAILHSFHHRHAHLVRMNADTAAAVAELPFVRWVGDYHPEFRLEPFLLAGLKEATLPAATRVRIQVCVRGPKQKELVAGRLEAMDAPIDALIPQGFWLEATLTPEQLKAVVTWDEVEWVDRWSPPESDMNRVRNDGGGNYVEMVAGYTGQGVRVEVMDGSIRQTHDGFQASNLQIHGTTTGDSDHGTKCAGIVFGDGTSDASGDGRGMLPDCEQSYFASYDTVANRYTHTAELVSSPWECVLQSNSWGSGRVLAYTSLSAQMDDIIFLNDILICQSQSNAGDQMSRPQAWAKNIVSVGGIRHYSTTTRTDDAWAGGASIGPAADGRLKPDLSFYYDGIRTADNESDTDYNSSFGGTSAATPEVAGHFGLFFQMWKDELFGNTVPVPGGTVFENRPHCTTAKAMLINTAFQYDFSGTGHDLTRVHQAWGTPDLQNLYDLRDKFFIVDETDILTNLATESYTLYVPPGEPALKVTMVYQDVMGTTSSSQHRINDLTLRVTSPMGTSFWGNVGLEAAPWSTAGGTANSVDTVENVFVQSPASGIWTIEVIADEINADTHVETPGMDADFALVVSGVEETTALCALADMPPSTWGAVEIGFTTTSLIAPTLDTTFEFSLDGGMSWSTCTAHASSPYGNPVLGAAPTTDTFIWDPAADGVATTMTAPDVLVRLSLDDGGMVPNPPCSTHAFDVLVGPPSCGVSCARSTLCGDCDGNYRVDILDAQYAARVAAGLAPTPVDFEACNVAGAKAPTPGADISIMDSLGIARHIVGIQAVECCDPLRLLDLACGDTECGTFLAGGAPGDLADTATTHFFDLAVLAGRSYEIRVWGDAGLELHVGAAATPPGSTLPGEYPHSVTGPALLKSFTLDDASMPDPVASYAGGSVAIAVKGLSAGSYFIDVTCDCLPIDITATGSYVGDTSTSTDTIVASCGGMAGSPDLAFTYTVQTPGADLLISTDHPGTIDDTILVLVSSCGSGALEILCDDDGGTGTTSELTLPAALGTYTIVVDSKGAGGAFELTVTEVINCTLEGTIGALPFMVSDVTTGADDTWALGCASGGAEDHVYEFTPAATSTYDFVLCTAGYDVAIGIYTGNCLTGTEVACLDDSCNGNRVELLDVPLDAGTTYYISVEGWAGSDGPYDLTVSTP